MTSTSLRASLLPGTAYIRGVLKNPPGSGVAVYVDSIEGFTASGTATARLYVSPAIGVPTAQLTRTALRSPAGVAPQALAYADVSATAMAAGTGTDTGHDMQFTSTMNQAHRAPWILDQGQSLGVCMRFTGVGLGASLGSFSIYWSETEG